MTKRLPITEIQCMCGHRILFAGKRQLAVLPPDCTCDPRAPKNKRCSDPHDENPKRRCKPNPLRDLPISPMNPEH